MTFKQGEILLVPVPFSDLTSKKKRPVLVLSNDDYNKQTNDIIIAAITSKIRGSKIEVVFDNDNMIDGKLQLASCVRPDKIYTLSKDIIVKKYGTISPEKVMEVKIRLMELLNN